MRRLVSTLAVAMVISLVVVSCGQKARVIPPSKFATIYAEMFVADQWVQQDGNRRKVDTLWFYNPIFEKYGYDRDDYFASVEYYLKDPSKYSAILNDAKTIITEKSQNLRDKMTENAALKTKSNVVCIADVSSFRNYKGRFYGKITYEFKDGAVKITRIPDVFPFRGPKVLAVDEIVRSGLNIPSKRAASSTPNVIEIPVPASNGEGVHKSIERRQIDPTAPALQQKLEESRERNRTRPAVSPERRQQVREKVEATKQRMQEIKKQEGRL